MQYELFYLVGGSKDAELEKIKSDVNEIVKANEGIFEEKETLEKRRMAYVVKHETHGIYTARRFEAEPEKINEITKKINLYPDVLRFIISRADELPELRSKEERMNAAVKEMRPVRETKAPEAPEKKRERPSPTKVEAQEDIDKKLEEILNI